MWPLASYLRRLVVRQMSVSSIVSHHFKHSSGAGHFARHRQPLMGSAKWFVIDVVHSDAVGHKRRPNELVRVKGAPGGPRGARGDPVWPRATKRELGQQQRGCVEPAPKQGTELLDGFKIQTYGKTASQNLQNRSYFTLVWCKKN